MNMSREVREELKALSKVVFGASSKWTRLMEYNQPLMTKITETVPGENGEPDTVTEKEVPLLVPGTKVRQSVRKYRSADEILVLLRDFKAKIDVFNQEQAAVRMEAAVKKQQEELEKKVQSELAGSSI